MKPVSSWGRLTADPHHVVSLYDRDAIAETLSQTMPGIAYGMGRSYGDVCLNAGGTLWSTTDLDRWIAWDPTTGRLRCEAGVLLKTIQSLCVPQGWILPVTPGTQWVTVGGAIANDVHGKNHHQSGSFGDHVHAIKMIRTDGTVIQCGPTQQTDWFSATMGGMGLTGLILEAEIQLQRVTSPCLDAETIPYHDLDTFFKLADASEKDWDYTVSWVDCLSKKNVRGLFMRANPSTDSTVVSSSKHTRTFPITPPFSCVNTYTLKLFNALYYAVHRRQSQMKRVHYEAFFYPLDHIQHWNRMYGRRGFYQYQCVLPYAQRERVRELLDEISCHQEGSFLAVLKTFGQRQAPGLMSFPMHGVTLALDFANKGERTQRLFQRLDRIVLDAKGRLYPAKNAWMSAGLFEAGYDQLSTFLNYRDSGISSELSRRLMGYAYETTR